MLSPIALCEAHSRLRAAFYDPSAYTADVSLKAAGTEWHPVISQAQPRPLCDFGAFFASKIPSMAGRVGQPQGWPVPVAGMPPQPDPSPLPLRFVAKAATVPSTTQEPGMNTSDLSGFPSAEAAAIGKVTLRTYLDKDPTFQYEMGYRLQRLTEALDFLECAVCESDFHRFDLPMKGLYGVLCLLSREAQMVSGLHDATEEFQEVRS